MWTRNHKIKLNWNIYQQITKDIDANYISNNPIEVNPTIPSFQQRVLCS